ncbi:MAG: hypothetical protein WBP16_02710, partial [Ferruginibacter sp.]
PNLSMNLENLEVNNIYADSLPLEQKVKFNCVQNQSGGYYHFTTNLFSGLDKNPFIAEQRISDIEYGYLQDFILVGVFSIPDGYVFEAVPENISLTIEDKSIVFSRFMTLSENQLNVRMSVEFRNSYYPVDRYSNFREFYKKLFEALNEQVIIKKK